MALVAKRVSEERLRYLAYARAEEVVARLSPKLHEQFMAVQRRLLRRLLSRLEYELPAPARQALLFRAAPAYPSPEVASWETAIQAAVERALADLRHEIQASVEDIQATDELLAEAMIRGSFLPHDPYVAELRAQVRELVERNILTALENRVKPDTLARALIKAREKATSRRDLEREIMARWGLTLPQAERIVRTTWTAASGHATLYRLEVDGFRYKRWIATHDDRVRGARKKDTHDHLHMDGQTVPLNEPFRDPRSGELVMFPGDPSLGASPGMLINCRCTIVGVSQEEGGARPEDVAADLTRVSRTQAEEVAADFWGSDPNSPDRRRMQYLTHLWVGEYSDSDEHRLIRSLVDLAFGEEPEAPLDWVSERTQKLFDAPLEEVVGTIRKSIQGMKARLEAAARRVRGEDVVIDKIAAWRGMRITEDQLREIARAWIEDPERPVKALARRLSSWSTDPDVGREFAGQYAGYTGLIVKVEVPVDRVVMAAAGDDLRFLAHWPEHELVLRSPEGGFTVPAREVKVTYKGHLYTFAEREKLARELGLLEKRAKRGPAIEVEDAEVGKLGGFSDVRHRKVRRPRRSYRRPRRR